MKEAQRVLLAGRQTQEKIVPGSARRTAARFSSARHGSREGRLGRMEGQPFGDDGIVTSLDQADQRRLRRPPSFACGFAA